VTRHQAPTAPIIHELSIGCVKDEDARVMLAASLRYDPTDPLAVTLAIRSGDAQPTSWTFARRLLADGVRFPTGQGHVRVAPSQDGRHRVSISLTSADGHADLDLPRDRAETFLHQTFAAVPATMEAGLIDWEAEFDPLLGPSRRQGTDGNPEPDADR
jgi:Streptomyces sporulation and cell division protein, SsgA